MTPDFQQLMRNATRLTRTGDLQAATAAIQAALAGTAPAPAAPRAMRDMADVIDVVARELPDIDAATPPRPAANDTPGPGRFIAGSHSNAAGRRDFKLYIPPGAGERALPLVVMLHG
ncbi:MAG: poly(3-hydroxyalkanoate) depolymerase, partial [Polaromonas sp.]|nr:poly(3-hydroxyalkanoate) depolymerase [Polaromonas sp.]